MCKKPVRNIHDGMKLLYYPSRVTGLWPFKYKNGNIVTLNTADKVKGYTLAVIFLILFITSGYIRHTINFQGKLGTATIINVICNLCGNSLAILSIILANSTYGNYSITFLSQLEDIYATTILYSKSFFDNLYKRLLKYFIIITTFGIFIIIFDVIRFYSLSYTIVLAYLNTYATQILLLFIFLQILYKVELLFYYFQNLNTKFESLHTSTMISKLGNCTTGQKCIPKNVKELSKIHKQLCNLIQITNDAHGWQIVLLFCTIAVHSLDSLYFGIIKPSSESARTAKTDEIVTVENIIAFKDVLCVLFQCSLLVLLSAKCSFTKRECFRTGVLAHDFLLDMSLQNMSKPEEICKEQLQLLIQNISYRNVHFSAGGIFDVDFRVISMLVGVVTTYFIVLLQFN